MSSLGIDAQFIDRCRAALERQVSEASELLNNFTGSRVDEVSEWIDSQPSKQQEALRWFQDLATHMEVALILNAVDNALAIVDLLDEPEGKLHTWAYVTLARTVVESATLFGHLSDRRVAPPQRLLRSAAMQMQGRLEEEKLAQALQDQEAVAALVKARQQLRRKMRKAGIEERLGGKGEVVGMQRGAEATAMKVNVTQESGMRLKRTIAPYRIGSAVTHSAWWYLASSLTATDGQVRPKLDLDHIVNAVALVLDSFEAMVYACAGPSLLAKASALSVATETRLSIVVRARLVAGKREHEA